LPRRDYSNGHAPCTHKEAHRRQAAILARLNSSHPRQTPWRDVQAPDEKTTEAEAVAEFKLNDEQRKRLVVQERN
jgi:hypothetical protein